MATIQEFIQVSAQLHTIASKVMEFQDDWVNLSDDYQGEVAILNSRLQGYEDEINQHRHLDKTVMEILKNAVRTLERAESRLDGFSKFASSGRCCSPIRVWCVKLIFVLFPENVEKIVKKVNADLENITKVLKEKAELSAQLREEDKRRPVPRLFLNNNLLYVPIEKAQQAVMAAIEDSGSHQFILLHGGVGKGKSTLARYLVHYYGQHQTNGNNVGQGNRQLFEHIIWVSCAKSSKADISTKQFEILLEHCPNTLGDSLPTDISGPKRVAKALQDFLRAKTVLMILDDVTDRGFLYDMWDSTCVARHVKYLVTSQLSNICGSLMRDSSISISMGKPTDNEAMSILASLVGLEAIPEKLQVIAKNILRETENNPLALACLARHFAYSVDKINKRAWQEAYTDLHHLLNNTEEKIVLGSTPRSLWAAMKLCIDSLENADARKILFVVYTCKGESVPEALLRILYTRIKATRSSFFQSSNELVMRELLKPSMLSKAKGQDDEGSQAWSLGSLVKHYIQEHMLSVRAELRSVIGELVCGDELATTSSVDYEQDHQAGKFEREKATFAIVLCGLYFDHTHHDIHELVKKAMAQTNIDFSNFNDLSRQAIEPIIDLVDRPADEHWEESDVSCVRRVLLTYICKCQLDDDNISQLLKLDGCPEAQLATLKAVGQICLSEERQLFKENHLNFLQAILHLTESKQDRATSVQEAAFRALRRVARKSAIEGSTPLIVDSPGVLDVLVSALAVHNEHPDLIAEDAASALANLSVVPPEHSSEHRQKIVSKERVLESLVQCLFKHDRPHLQEAGTAALANLALDGSIKCRIANQDGALVGLVRLLCAHDRPTAQERAASALTNLSKNNDSFKRRIVNEEGALAGLVECLGANEHPGVQEHGVWALGHLADCTDITVQWNIANQEGALVGLVKLLSAHDTQRVRQGAVLTLTNLAATDDNSLQRRIVDQEGALAGLVECLATNEQPDAQMYGAGALGNLACSTNNSIKCSIANQEGALVGLVKLLSAHDRPSVQEQAARALSSLAFTNDDSLKRQIADQGGALAGLTACLATNEHPEVQEYGALALSYLASCTYGTVKWSIVNEDRALGCLVQSLSAHDRPRVQANGASALINLAASKDTSIGCRVANQDGALVGLVELLSGHYRASVQQQAGHALSNLAAMNDDSLRRRIADQEGALAGLVKCLAADEHPVVQEKGACALAHLARCTDSTIKSRVANQEGALVGLVKLLSAHDRPSLQEHAARAFYNLTTNDACLQRRIANQEGALAGLVECLAMKDQPALQTNAASALSNLAQPQDARTLLHGTDGLLKGLTCLLEADIPPGIQSLGARALTLVNVTLGKQASLSTAEAYWGRAKSLNYLKMHAEALADLDKAVELQNGAKPYIFSHRCFTRTKIADFDGALEDANEVLKVSESDRIPFALQERGILKRIMGDLEGALADLDEGLKLKTDDYESLKHRGYVKFLLKDEEGARADAEWAMRIKPSRVDGQDYERGHFLGAIPVEYLGYKLK